jgi:hypothetical protein
VAQAPFVAPTPAPVASVPVARQAAVPAPTGNGEVAPTKVIVPVKLSKGGTYEIVIRLQIDADA